MVSEGASPHPNPDLTVDNFVEVVARIMHGAIDMHVHCGPDVPPFPSRTIARHLDAVQTAQLAKEAGMRAVVLKSHTYPTAPLVPLIRNLVPGIEVFGTVVLNHSIGGLNPLAVEIAAKVSGGKVVVFMPTWNAAEQLRRGARGAEGSQREGISLLDERGRLRPEVHEVLEVVQAHDLVVTTGHTSLEEHLALVEEARRRGIAKVVVSHVRSYFPLEARRQLADLGAIIEHAFLQVMPLFGRQDPQWIVDSIRAIGAERCSIATDIGHVANPDPAQAYRMFVATLLHLGLTEEEVRRVAQVNPAWLLGLEERRAPAPVVAPEL